MSTQENPLVPESNAPEVPAAIPDDELGTVSGGVYVGQRVHVRGMVYYTSFCDPGDERGWMDGYIIVDRYVEGRAAPIGFFLGKDHRWVKESAVV